MGTELRCHAAAMPLAPMVDRDRVVIIMDILHAVASLWKLCRFQKTKRLCQQSSDCEMGGWTRILHEGYPDRLMKELNTFVAEPHPHAGM